MAAPRISPPASSAALSDALTPRGRACAAFADGQPLIMGTIVSDGWLARLSLPDACAWVCLFLRERRLQATAAEAAAAELPPLSPELQVGFAPREWSTQPHPRPRLPCLTSTNPPDAFYTGGTSPSPPPLSCPPAKATAHASAFSPPFPRAGLPPLSAPLSSQEVYAATVELGEILDVEFDTTLSKMMLDW
jgi:hypothetical protein